MYKVPYHFCAKVIDAGKVFAEVDGFWSITAPEFEEEANKIRDEVRTRVMAEGAKISSESKVIITSLTRV